ncbi:hypothetical protein IC006_2388 [Sulfuracidifex tepidarius]|uniref:Uncharacterized protein n=1 Tax=Sulfuracidifex tepidarius TaxID=1294262 RepID=A0A510DXW5_9CREN|nr:hypothetical protein [Sulfuracidifex tepidarius]BBG25053.1 hypothetical protein IC006_2388 [Sulfuracidifex tepidarius]
MILGTLGSDKMVTTVNAILSEVFTEVFPSEVRIYTEDDPSFDYSKIKDFLRVLNVDADVKVVRVGKGISRWKDVISKESLDVADVTPGRKYMALALHNYSNSGQVRYVYLENERKGYRPFGYTPFHEIKVVDLRQGTEVKMKAIKTRGSPSEVNLNYTGLRMTLNMLSLLGEVKLDYTSDEKAEEFCKSWSGEVKFKEESEMAKARGRLIADTNVYMSMGPRLLYFGDKVLPSSSTYAELLSRTDSTQKMSPELTRFHLGMYAFRLVHDKVPDPSKKFGDVPLINEAKYLKSEMSEEVTLVTGDSGVMRSARSKGLNVIYLHDREKGKVDFTSKALCLSAFTKVDVNVNGDTFLNVRDWQFETSKVRSLKQDYNYAYLSYLLTKKE